MIEQIKKEIYYYTGKRVTDDEALEILDFQKENPGASLDEILNDYYGG